MWSFLTGIVAAALLATITFFVLDFGAVTSVDRVDNQSLIIDEEVHSLPMNE